ncbi:MAG TPA: biotin/lipoyl-containing protein, partial [Ktedonobacterales bacterium]
PVLVKASAGGGGKGMRAVDRPDDLPAALAAARREARSAFGDATLLLEKLIVEPRHVEFQIFGDTHGHLLHLGERECSIQRRHQKVIEETPSTALTPDLRARMAAAALTVGRQLNYTSAGTVEFVLDPDGGFYFLEVNTRLQVEHPVTELVTGLDLVRWQILVAEGYPLPLTQDEITFQGHAVEARIYAEDPARGYLPATGHIALWREPEGDGVRVDSGIQTGDTISAHYDPLLAKLSAHGADRAEALRRLDRALSDTVLFGVRDNIPLLRRTLLHPAHLAGQISTRFLERHASDLLAAPTDAPREMGIALAAVAAALQRVGVASDPPAWRNNPNRPITERYVPLDEDASAPPVEVRLTARSAGEWSAEVRHGDQVHTRCVLVRERQDSDLWLEVDGHLVRAVVRVAGGECWVKLGPHTYALRWRSPFPDPAERARREGTLTAPMPGQVIAVFAEEGQVVQTGDPLLVLQAMKMEHVIAAPYDGTVTHVHFRIGESVPASAILLDLHPAPAPHDA